MTLLPDDLPQCRIGNTLRKRTRICRNQAWGYPAALDDILFNRFEMVDNMHILQRFRARRIIRSTVALRPVCNHLLGEHALPV
jgi:hypothetical protein